MVRCLLRWDFFRLIHCCSVIERVGSSMGALGDARVALVLGVAALRRTIEHDLVATKHGVELFNLLDLAGHLLCLGLSSLATALLLDGSNRLLLLSQELLLLMEEQA